MASVFPLNSRWTACVLGLSLLAGCATSHKAAPPLTLPGAAAVSVRHFVGTPLSGTVLKDPPAFSPDDALALEVSFVALEQSPQGVNPLGAHARLIIASHGANPVRSTGGLTRIATYAIGNDAQRFVDEMNAGMFERRVPMGNLRGALPAGVTARFEVTDSGAAQVTLPSGLGHRRFQLQISRGDKNLFTKKKPATGPATGPATAPAVPATRPSSAVEIEFAVELDDIAAPDAGGREPSEGAATGAPQTPILHIETVLLDPLLIDPEPSNDHRTSVVVAVPFRFRDGSNESVAAIIRIGKGSAADAAHRASCTLAARDLVASYKSAQADAEARPPASPDESTVMDLLASIAHPAARRAATAYLASWSGARYCEDVALSCDNKTLADLTNEFPAEITKVAGQKPAVGWRLDRITLNFLVKLQGNGELPPELAAILSDRAGEAGRHSSAMEEILRDVAGPVDLDQRLVAINRQYLEDSSPASRARAYDWLKNRSRHEEPAGYLPLGPSRERRAALDKDLLDRAAAATRPSTQPTGVP
jgi:hypothetical protein